VAFTENKAQEIISSHSFFFFFSIIEKGLQVKTQTQKGELSNNKI
jgi:hypothetical protein